MEAFGEERQVPGAAPELEDPMTRPDSRLIYQRLVDRSHAQQPVEGIVEGQ